MSKRFLSQSGILAVVGVLAVGLAGVGLDGSLKAVDPPKSWGFDTANLDRTCKACDDFYRFAMGGWMKANPIPPEYSIWGSFSQLADRNQKNLREVLEAAAESKAAAGTNEQKIGDFYSSCMDATAIDAAGAKPIEPELTLIAAVGTLADLEAETARLHKQGVGVLFRFTSTQDAKDSSQVIGAASQGGLGLPEREYYLKQDEKSQKLREDYVKHVANMFALLGDSADVRAAEAATVLKMETALATASMKNTDLRDPDKTYHKMTLAELRVLTPGFSWESYFTAVGHPELKEINVGQPDFFKALNAQLTATSIADWKSYLRWHLVNSAAPGLAEKFVNEDFDFRGKTLTGAKEIQPRWKRCVQSTDRNLGEALGQAYVQKYFPPAAKARALEMVHNLLAALRDDLETLPWMGPETRAQARAKLEAFAVKIGYTDKWRDYAALKIDRRSYAENLVRASEFDFARRLNKIGKPVDRTEWGMTPPTVNAYNNSSMNEIVFPAGIMQPPFYDPNADDAVNYGGMGAVIGHEITHGFDDHGSKFDGKGNLKDWWTPEDLKNFQSRAKCVSDQFDGYVVDGDLHENGKLVLGESIADLGGLAIAYAAYEKSLEGKPRPPDRDGFTPEQRFFLGWAQVWGANERLEYARLMANTNPHPLGRFRANGPLSNMAEFAKAFGCKHGEAMVREQACKIW
ncbi:MAG TPA: M13 family metallopeptidase [Candidatus Acidoferrum sp.]|jgi:putative endopeptidase|nr:M13 family metallopeptidase [Candidatus Acidoferrum sp.]